jgi:hypothetical protein
MKTRADLMTLPAFRACRCRVCTSEQIDWADSWSCQCDDDCPECGTAIQPEESIWLGPEGPERDLWESLPDA